MVNLFFFFLGGGKHLCTLAPKCTGFDWYKMQYIYQVENFAII